MFGDYPTEGPRLWGFMTMVVLIAVLGIALMVTLKV